MGPGSPDAPIRRHATGMAKSIRRATAALLAVAHPCVAWVWSPARAVATTWAPRSATAIVTAEPDTSPPVTFPPIIRLARNGSAAASDVPVTIGWPAATDLGTGVATYELRRRFDGGALGRRRIADRWWPGAFRRVCRPPGPSSTRSGPPTMPGTSVRGGPAMRSMSGSRPSVRPPSAMVGRGARRCPRCTSAGRRSSRARRARRPATRSSVVRSRGSPRVDRHAGPHVSTWTASSSRPSISEAATLLARRLVFTHAWTKVGRHRITVRVSGTGRVDVDGFAVVDAASAYPVLVGAGDIASCSNSGDSATSSPARSDTRHRIHRRRQCLRVRYHLPIRDRATTRRGAGTRRGRARCPGTTSIETTERGTVLLVLRVSGGLRPATGWYAYDVGTWRIYSLNSNCAFVGGCGAGSAQEAWLRADLAANPRALRRGRLASPALQLRCPWRNDDDATAVEGPSGSRRGTS